MNMKYQNSISRLQRYYQRCAVAISLVICLLLSNINFSMMLTYAKLDDQISFKVGDNVTAVLENGVLTLSGDGSTDNFSAETAPFLEYASSIQTLVIENGITNIGSYLFYGLGNLSGELVLPSSINHFGDYAFSGDSQQNAAHFSLIRNEFLTNEIVQQTPDNQVPEVVPQPDTETNQPVDNTTDMNQPEGDIPSVNDTPTSDNNSDNIGENEQVPDNSLADETQGNDNSVQNEQTGNESGMEDTPLLAVVGTTSFSMIKNLMNYTLNESDEIQEVPSDSIPPENESADTNTDEKLDSDVPNETDPIISDQGVDNENGSNSDTPSADSGTTSSDANEPPVDEFPSVDETISSNSDAASGSDATNEPVIENPIYKVETITQQTISDPANLFYAGQVGIVVCSDQNESFLTAATMAGYQKADGIATVIIDDKNERKLPVYEGKITLPLQSEGSADPYADDMFFIGKFEGWTLSKNTESAVVYPAGSSLEVTPDSETMLYSTWVIEAKYRLLIKAVRKDDTASYSLIEESSQAPLNVIEGYEYNYQWQIADKNTHEENRVWNNIAGAQSAVYERAVEPDDVSKLFRCVVTVVKQAALLSESEPIQLFSEPIAAAVETITVYVDAANGDDSTGEINDEQNPYKTLTAAAAQLTREDADGTTESNVIVLLSDYKFDAALNANFLDVPVTIKGQTNTIKLIGLYSGDKDLNINNQINLKHNVVFENITLDDVGHIYGNGNDITCGENVITVVSPYLYGAENGKIGDKVGNITIKSGNYSRIAAYARSTGNTPVDVKNKSSVITISGGTVTTLISGSANGGIENADVTINISDTGTVTSLVGGCQGFNNNIAGYSGKTVINVSGGTVTNLYGAGTGRNASVPTFKGDLDINVSGGTVTNLYGAGTLAQVISDSTTSLVDVDVSGGHVNNIYAAGIGGDIGQYKYEYGSTTEYIKNPQELGSITGNVNITVSGTALIGNIYGSGKGFDGYETITNTDQGFLDIIKGAKENAFVKGNVVININGGTITGDVYGGGEGINKDAYDKSARITEGSTVKVVINDGVINGNVYGGGKYANNEGTVSVTMNGGTVEKNIYGGGNQGKLLNKSEVNIYGGTIHGSVYGGALGDSGKLLLINGATVNMVDGTIHGNLYGGSQNSNDGKTDSKEDLIFVNLVGGTIKGNVFGGSYKGYVNGSTHVHIGEDALAKCAYYTAHLNEMPELTGKTLYIEGSAYAGGDFGGDTINYDNITIAGYSHLYIDGNGYFNNGKTMTISGGVFGSGASCDAGGVRLVTLDHFGNPAIDSNGKILDSASTLTAIQRADQVRLINSHVRLSGQSDVANVNQTAPYSLNQIGNLGLKDELINNIYGNSLVLQDGSTLILDSAAIEIADLKSMSGENIVTDHTVKNTILLNSGTVFRVAYTPKDRASTVYGNLYGKTYLLAGNTAEAYAYAANNTDQIQGEFIGFDGKDLSYESLTDFRYWKIKGDEASIALRNTVLTAQNVQSASDGYAVAQGSIELSPVTKNTSYKISKITIPVGLELVEVAKNKSGEWKLAGKVESDPTTEQIAKEQDRIEGDPLSVFGLYIGMGEGFSEAAQATGSVISNESAKYDSASSIIGNEIPARAVTEGNIPEVEFYLTYKNDAINISKDIGTVIVEVEQYENDILQDIIKMNVQIVTKASSMVSEQTIDLYASQDGNYTDELIIPAGNTMELYLKEVSTSSGSSLVQKANILNPSDFAVTIQPINGSGWQKLSQTDPYDIKNKTAGSSILLGTTDSRFEASIEINLYNARNFISKTDDVVTLVLSDGKQTYKVTLNIHWTESIVSKTELYSGKQYNALPANTSSAVTQKGAVTAVFTIRDRCDLDTLWLDKGSLPIGTKMTSLLGYNNEFYTYTITGSEVDEKVLLCEFTKMWASASKLNGTVEKNQQLRLILDFDAAVLSNGTYQISLKNENGAAPVGQSLTVKAEGSPALTVNTTSESGKYSIQLTHLSDTHFGQDAGLVLTLDNENLPEWLKFSYQDKTYSPVNGKLYLPKVSDNTPIIMDTVDALNFNGNKIFKADVYAVGFNAGSSAIANLSSSINLTAVPAYALDVNLSDTQKRVVKAKDTLSFDVTYTLKNVNQAKIDVKVFKKSDAKYEKIASWDITGSTDVTSSGQGIINITVPENTEKGTYRILFTLGNQEVPYNIIVQ